MKGLAKKITSLAVAAAMAASLGVSATADVALVDTYAWTATKTNIQGAPTSAGSRPDIAYFYYSNYGYTTGLTGAHNSNVGASGSVTVSCPCGYADMDNFRLSVPGEVVYTEIVITGTVTSGIPFKYTAFTETTGNTFTGSGTTTIGS